MRLGMPLWKTRRASARNFLKNSELKYEDFSVLAVVFTS
jgi:hypothetical protein